MKETPHTDNESKKKPKGFYANDPKDYNTKNGASESKAHKKYYLKTQGPGEGRIPKDKNSESVSEFISEGNPNTEKIIQETKEHAAQSPEEVYGLPGEVQNDQSKEDEQVSDLYNDEKLVDEIQGAIEKEDLISDTDKSISVTVEDGIVTLKGMVSSEKVKQNIEDKAVSFVGHNRVGNYLQVDRRNRDH